MLRTSFNGSTTLYSCLLLFVVDSVEKRPSMKLIFVGHDLINLPSYLTSKKIQDKGV